MIAVHTARPTSARQDQLALLDAYVRLPTVSGRISRETVAEVIALWVERGLALEPLPQAEGTPTLLGEIAGPGGAPTLLIYGHYDVQPPGDLALWSWNGATCDPFGANFFLDGQAIADPRTLDDEQLDRLLLVARGSADNKGQHAANLIAALDAAAAGSLQWRVLVLLDGEEESGSPRLADVVRAHRDRLAADLRLCADAPKEKNRPTLVLGVRGSVHVHLTAENGQKTGVHSGNYGNRVPNPVLPLARLVDDLDAGVREFASENFGFRDEVEGAFSGAGDETWRAFLWPTVNPHHFGSEGTAPDVRRLVIPRAAHARIDVRVTPDTPPDRVVEIAEAVVADHAGRTDGIRFTLRIAGTKPASYTSLSRPEYPWLLQHRREQGEGEPVVLPILGGTLPTWIFTDILEAPTFVLPSANADNQQHDANEHYALHHYFAQIAMMTRLLSSRPAP